jgi:16S rRNA (guanine(1405)-N(7))-methyltransferase
MSETEKDQLEQLVSAILESSKYRMVCQDFIRLIGSQELTKRPNLKAAIKSSKNKLHQVGGAYLDHKTNYAVWLDELRKATQSKNREDLLKVCREIMSHHSSTKERLAILDQFYTTILSKITPIHSVLDIACGLNPLAIPWMPLTGKVNYYACDIYQDMMDFLNCFIEIIGLNGRAKICDALQFTPNEKVDVAFILKTIPCLEQVDKTAGIRLLELVNSDYIIVSFPAQSLSGKNKGMLINYEAFFRNMVAEKNWSIERFEFATELAFLVKK